MGKPRRIAADVSAPPKPAGPDEAAVNRARASSVAHDLPGDAASAARRFATLYAGRRDVQGTETGGCLRRVLTIGHYAGHLQGAFGLGVYPLLDDGTCWFCVVDIDEQNLDAALLLRRLLSDSGLNAFVFTSRSRGYHVAVFFAGRVRAHDARAVILHQVIEAGLPPSTEIYPRADYVDPVAKAPGGYIRLPYVCAMPNGKPPSIGVAPGRRVALDLTTLRPLPFEDFLAQAEAGRISPECVRSLADELRADSATADLDEVDVPARVPRVRQQLGLETLPPDPAALGVPVDIARVIRDGIEGSKYESRSEAQLAVANSLVAVGYDDATIEAVLTCPKWRISERALGQSDRRRKDAFRRVLREARSSTPTGKGGTGNFFLALHRELMQRRMPALAWAVAFEIAATTDYRTGLSRTTPEAIAKRLGCTRSTVYRGGLEPLRAEGLVEAVPIATAGQWRQKAHRITIGRLTFPTTVPTTVPTTAVLNARDTDVARTAARARRGGDRLDSTAVENPAADVEGRRVSHPSDSSGPPRRPSWRRISKERGDRVRNLGYDQPDGPTFSPAEAAEITEARGRARSVGSRRRTR